MAGQDDRIYEEAAALWRQIYGVPPPQGADGRRILALIMTGLPDARYARFSSFHLRPGAVTFPGAAHRRPTP